MDVNKTRVQTRRRESQMLPNRPGITANQEGTYGICIGAASPSTSADLKPCLLLDTTRMSVSLELARAQRTIPLNYASSIRQLAHFVGNCFWPWALAFGLKR